MTDIYKYAIHLEIDKCDKDKIKVTKKLNDLLLRQALEGLSSELLERPKSMFHRLHHNAASYKPVNQLGSLFYRATFNGDCIWIFINKKDADKMFADMIKACVKCQDLAQFIDAIEGAEIDKVEEDKGEAPLKKSKSSTSTSSVAEEEDDDDKAKDQDQKEDQDQDQKEDQEKDQDQHQEQDQKEDQEKDQDQEQDQKEDQDQDQKENPVDK